VGEGERPAGERPTAAAVCAVHNSTDPNIRKKSHNKPNSRRKSFLAENPSSDSGTAEYLVNLGRHDEIVLMQSLNLLGL
jgi:hypothetical protein